MCHFCRLSEDVEDNLDFLDKNIRVYADIKLGLGSCLISASYMTSVSFSFICELGIARVPSWQSFMEKLTEQYLIVCLTYKEVLRHSSLFCLLGVSSCLREDFIQLVSSCILHFFMFLNISLSSECNKHYEVQICNIVNE